MNREPTYYGILPAVVRYDNRLGMGEKVLFTEFNALCNKTGVCTAHNRYFADLYDVSLNTISKWIKKLEDCGHIKAEIHQDKGNKREIKLVAIQLQLETSPTQVVDPSPTQVVDLYNTTSINNKSNSIATELLKYYYAKYIDRCKRKPRVSGGWIKNLEALLRNNSVEEVKKVMVYFFAYESRVDFSFYTFVKKYDALAPKALSTLEKPHPQGVKGWTCKKCGKINTHSGIICLGCQEERC